MTGAWPSAREILAVRLDAIGDVLMTTPALRALRGVEGTRVTLLTSPSGARVAPLIPEVDDVMVYDAPWVKHGRAPDPARDLAMIKELSARRFDAAAIFTVFTQSALPAALLCHVAGIPLRAAHCRENPYGLLTEWVPEPEPERGVRHEVRRQLDLAAEIGRTTEDDRLSLWVPDPARARVRELLRRERIDADEPWVAVHPGATAPSRRYPPEAYARAAARLSACGLRIVFTGSPAERDLVDEIRAEMAAPSWSLAGRLDLEGLAALIEAAPVLLTNNTGPAHVAAAVGTPVVVPYALTNPQHTPWRVPSRVLFHDVPCRNCFKSVCPEGHHRCLRGVPASDVADAVLELLASTRRRAAADGSGGVLVPAGS